MCLGLQGFKQWYFNLQTIYDILSHIFSKNKNKYFRMLIVAVVNAIQKGTHNTCLYKEVDKKYTHHKNMPI